MNNLASLLDNEHKQQLEKRKMIESVYLEVLASYEIHPKSRSNCYINNDYAVIYFNGNTRMTISEKRLTLTGFGLKRCPGAELSRVAGCGDEGTISGDLKTIINALAKYERIYPKGE